MTHQNEWHLDKKVPLSLIFAMLMQGAMVIWAIADIKKDVEISKAQAMALHEIVKAQSIAQHDRDDRQDRTSASVGDLLRAHYEKIDAKLDRLIEKTRK